jgi:hypothetical protein
MSVTSHLGPVYQGHMTGHLLGRVERNLHKIRPQINVLNREACTIRIPLAHTKSVSSS